jgi:hypothetical protein
MMKRTIELLAAALILFASLHGCTTSDRYDPLRNPHKVVDGVRLSTFEWPRGLEEDRRSDIYKVTLVQGYKRIEIPVFINRCPVYSEGYQNMTATDRIPFERYAGNTISWASFCFDGEVTVEVEVLDTSTVPLSRAVAVLPSRHGVTPRVSGNTVSFTLTGQAQYSLEIGSNGYKNGLMIFADPMEEEPVPDNSSEWHYLDAANAADIAALPEGTLNVCFKNGTHDIGVWNVPSSVRNIYFENGVWVYGALRLGNTSDVKIFGRGVLSSSRMNFRQSHCIETTGGSNIALEGITVADPRHFSVRLLSTGCNVGWTKVIGGWNYNCDGIVVYDNSLVHDCFTWANDDNIKAYMPGVRFEDMVLWQLNNGGAIQLGWYNAVGENIELRRIDLLHADWNNVESNNRGVISYVGNKPTGVYQADPSGVTWQKGLLIEDLVVETPVPFIFRIAPQRTSLLDPPIIPNTPAYIEGFTMRNWNIKVATPMVKNQILGVSSDYPMTGFVFDNVYINGNKLSAANWESGNFETEFFETPTFQ